MINVASGNSRKSPGKHGPLRDRMRSFACADRGALALVMGLTLVPVVAAVGATFDYARISTGQSGLANALDAAGLAAVKQLSEPDQTVQSIAQNFLERNLPDSGVFSSTPVVQILQKTDEVLQLSARGKVSTAVMGLFNVNEIEVYAEAEFTRKVQGLEIAMVLDTTYSMKGTRMTAMKAAAKDLLQTLYGSDRTSDRLRIALVPFADMVNIKATRPDWRGESLDFSVDDGVDPLAVDAWDRAAQDATILSHYTGADWAWIDVTGNARYNGWNIDDHRYVERNGNGGVNYRTAREYDSEYSPDPFEFGTKNNGDRLVKGGKYVPCSHKDAKGCDYEAVRNDHLWLYKQVGLEWRGCVESRPVEDAEGEIRDLDITVTAPDPDDPDTLFVPSFHADGGSGGYPSWMTDKNEFGTGNGPKVPSGSLDRLAYLNKYYQNDPKVQDVADDEGPNLNCGIPVTPLVSSRDALEEDIDALTYTTSTNIPEGLAWGWRMLDPQPPFDAALPYGHVDDKGVRWQKAIVLLTDGENWTRERRYNSYGFADEDRLTGPEGESDIKRAMDKRLAKLCTNVKNAGKDVGGEGIRLYVVAFDMNGSVKDTLFKPCASDPAHFFDAQGSVALSSAFKKIGADLASLRISK